MLTTFFSPLESYTYSRMKTNDIFVTLDDSGLHQGKTPLVKNLYIKTQDSSIDLNGSVLLYAREMRLAVNRSLYNAEGSLEERKEELEEYRQAGCVFYKNPDPDSNFYRVEQTGSGTIWIYNKGQRSLRFQTADGLLYRVCAGTCQPLTPDNARARLQPPKILLDADGTGNPMDIQIRAVHVLDHGLWCRGDVCLHCGSYTDSYDLRVRYQDDCLGIFESYGRHLGRPALEVLDIDNYGPAQWYIRNLGGTPLALRKGCVVVPADRHVYVLNDLLTCADSLQQED